MPPAAVEVVRIPATPTFTPPVPVAFKLNIVLLLMFDPVPVEECKIPTIPFVALVVDAFKFEMVFELIFAPLVPVISIAHKYAPVPVFVFVMLSTVFPVMLFALVPEVTTMALKLPLFEEDKVEI